MNGLNLTLLGGFSATLHSTNLTTFRSQKTQALLAYLAVESGRVHQRESLIDLLWSGQPPKQANSNFRQSLSRLQKVIGNKEMASPYLVITRKSVQWNPSSEYKLDVDQLLQATDEALVQTDLAQAFNHAEVARDLYHGDFLAGFFVSEAPYFDNWVTSTREQLHQQVVRALGHVADRAEIEGQFDQAIELSTHQLLLSPSSEYTYRRLMRALALRGERANALAQFARCMAALRQELDVEASDETKTLYQLILSGEFPPPSASKPVETEEKAAAERADPQHPFGSKTVHQLPTSLIHFVGRKQEVEEVIARLADPASRLVTLTGPGGMGKTSLALEVAAAVSSKHTNGAAFVALAAVDDGEMLVPAILQALGLSLSTELNSTEYLLESLEPLDLLLVLDNYEQLLPQQDERAQPTIDQRVLVAILERAPLVTLLITSRVRLNLPQEWVYPLNGMTLPPMLDVRLLEGDQLNLAQFEQSNAVALFVHSARQVHPIFTLTAKNVHAVARICRLLEGTPLGLQLAAAWVRALTCQEICTEIEAGFQILTASSAHVPERHRSLYTLFDSSWQKLSTNAQEVVLRLSIFRSHFDRPAATEIADASISTVAELIDHSFVRRVGSGEYQMHELMRQLAAEKLAANAELSTGAKEAHAFYFGRYLVARSKPFFGADSTKVLFEIEERFGDITMAWEYLTQHQHFQQLDSSLDALNRYCRTRGRIARGAELFEQAIAAHERSARKSPAERLFHYRLMSRLGGLYVSLGQHEKAHALITDSLQLGLGLQSQLAADRTSEEGLFDPNPADDASRSLEATLAYCHWCLLFVPSAVEDGDRVDYLFAEGIALYKKCELHMGVADMYNIRGVIAHNRGDLRQAHELYKKSYQLFNDINYYSGLALTLYNLGKVNEELGNYEDGLRYLQQALQHSYVLSDDENIAFTMACMARIGMYQGQYEDAEAQAKEAFTRFEQIRFQQGIAFTCELLGEILLAQGRVDEAERYLTQGIAVCQRHSYPIEAALVTTTHATVALHQFELERAQEFAKAALQFAQQGHSRSAEGPVHSVLGEIAVHKEEFEEARVAFETAIEIGQEIRAPLVWLKAQVGLAELEMRIGESGKSQQLVREVLDHKAATHQLKQRIVSIL